LVSKLLADRSCWEITTREPVRVRRAAAAQLVSTAAD